MPFVTLIMLALLMLPLPGWSIDLPLFVIQRSTNRNEVQYQLRVDDRCHLAPDNPVNAFWKRLEEGPETTRALSVWDRIAYGVVEQQVTGNWVVFSLKALEAKRLKASATAIPTGTCAPIVQVEINGHWAALERIYVQVEEGMIKPKVVYVDVYGTSLDTPAIPVQERLTP